MISSPFFRQLLAFAGIGVAATVTHYLVALIFSHWVSVFYANPAGFAVAFSVSYIGHMRITFRLPPGDRRHAQRLPRFIVMAGCGFLLSQSILVIVSEGLKLASWAALAISTAVIPAATFIGARFWVFAPQRSGTQHNPIDRK